MSGTERSTAESGTERVQRARPRPDTLSSSFNEGFSKVMHIMRLHKKFIKRTIKVDINGPPRSFKTGREAGTNKQIDDNGVE